MTPTRMNSGTANSGKLLRPSKVVFSAKPLEVPSAKAHHRLGPMNASPTGTRINRRKAMATPTIHSSRIIVPPPR